MKLLTAVTLIIGLSIGPADAATRCRPQPGYGHPGTYTPAVCRLPRHKHGVRIVVRIER